MPKANSGDITQLEDAFGRVWPVHLSAFTKLLVQLRAEFDGDLDLMLVLSVIADRTRPEEWTPELLTYRQLTRGNGDDHMQDPINLQSVADYSGIPRETVRRTVAILEAKGWVSRDARGLLMIGRKSAGDLEAATMHSVAYLAALLPAISSTRAP